jgi:hypothetical protein
MRWLTIALLSIAFVPALHAGEKDGKVEKVNFDIYQQPYFVKNTAPIKGNPACLVITSKKQFDEIFGVGFVMKQKYKLIDDKTFESKMVLVVVNKGNAFWTYKDVRTEQCKGKITLQFAADMTPSSSTSAVPLIVAVERGGNTRVLFREGDKELAEVNLQETK